MGIVIVGEDETVIFPVALHPARLVQV